MGCNSSKVVETTDVQQNNPKKPVENESVRHEPMKDSDRGDKRKMLVGTKTKLQMEVSWWPVFMITSGLRVCSWSTLPMAFLIVAGAFLS